MTRDERRHYQRVYREKQRNKVKEVQQRKLEKEIAKMMSVLEISKKEAMCTSSNGFGQTRHEI